MKIRFAPRGIVEIDDARIIFRNFSGEPSKYNRKGDRNFAVIIPNQEIADELMKEGWNVRIKPPRDIDDSPFIYLPVKVKFNDRGPAVSLRSGSALNRLDEESISCLDHVAISSVDLDIRPYDWEMNGDTGRTAYLQSIRVTQDIRDRFAEEEYPE